MKKKDKIIPKILFGINLLLAISCLIAFCGLIIYIFNKSDYAPPAIQGYFPYHEKWRTKLPEQIMAEPVITTNVVVVRTGDTVLGLDINTGAVSWQLEFSSYNVTSSPVVVKNLVIVANQKSFKGVNLQSGKVIWEYVFQERMFWEPEIAAINDQVFFMEYGGIGLGVHDLNDGKLLWKIAYFKDSAEVHIDGQNAIVLVMPKIFSYEIATGRLLDVIGDTIGYSSSYNNKILYFQTSEKQKYSMIAIDTIRKINLWQIPNISRANASFTWKDNVIIASDSSIFAVDRLSGKLQWKFYGGEGFDRVLLVEDVTDIIYCRGYNPSTIYILDPLGGREMGRIQSSIPSWFLRDVWNKPYFDVTVNNFVITQGKDIYLFSK